MEHLIVELGNNLALLDVMVKITDALLFLIFIFCIVAAWFCWWTFDKVGFGPIGHRMSIAIILLAISFAFIGATYQFIYDMTLAVRILVGLTARVLQLISSILLAMSFWKYYYVARAPKWPRI